jgi:galactokinase/mevalonate kinase-like predicted kinase
MKGELAMTTQAQVLTRPEPHQDQTVEKKTQQLRKLYADAPQFAKTALENTLKELTSAVDRGWKALAGPARARARCRS